MSNPNPFEFLRNQRGGEGEQVERPDNPFDSLIQGTTPRYEATGSLTPPTRRAGDRFIRGIGRGMLYPVRAFTGDLSADEGLAGVAGEVVGTIGGFVPFFLGARKVALGVGLARPIVTREGTKVGLSNLGHFVTGTSSYAVYETFAGETIEEAPQRFFRGLAEGAAFEAAFLGVAAAWRRRFPRFDPPPSPDTSPMAPKPEVSVHPLALKLELWMRPEAGESASVIAGKLKELGSPQAQLHESVMKIVHNHMGGGHTILPGVTQREIKQIFKTADELGNIKIRPFKRIEGPDGENLYDLLVYDQGRSSVVPDIVAGKASLQEVLDAVKRDFTDLGIEFPDVINWRGTAPFGLYVPDERMAYVAKKTTKGNEYVQTAVLLHEIAHHLTYSLTVFKGKQLTTANVLQKAYDRLPDSVKKILPPDADTVRIIRAELEQVTEEVETLTRQYLHGVNEAVARENALRAIEANPGYYDSATELFSRLTEMMFYDPQAASKIAPLSTTLFTEILRMESPKIQSLLSRGGRQLKDYLDQIWVKQGDAVTVFHHGPLDIADWQLQEWGKTGFFRYMRGFVDGKEVEVNKILQTGQLEVKNLQNGKMSLVEQADFQRPLLTASARRSRELIQAIDGMLTERPNWVALNLTQPMFEGGTRLGEAVRRTVVNLEDFHFIDGPLFSWVRSLPEEIQEQVLREIGTISLPNLSSLRKLPNREAEALTESLDKLVKLTGKKGLAYYNNGQLELLISDRSVFQFGAIESLSFGSYVAGPMNSKILIPSMDDVIKTMLREKGVAEGDLPYYLNIARDRLGNRMRTLVDPDVRQATENVETIAAQGYRTTTSLGAEEIGEVTADVTRGLDASASRANMEVNLLADGRIELRDMETKTVLGRFAGESDAHAFVNSSGPEGIGPDLGNFPGGGSHGGNGGPPKFQQMFPADSPIPDPPTGPTAVLGHGRGESVADALNILGASITALENVARSVERRGFGAAFSKIFDPTQRAIAEVDRQLAEVKRSLLGGVSYNEYLRGVAKKLSGIRGKRQAKITQYMEALSREEIAAPGGLLQRGMNENELRVANFIDQMGLAHDVPRLMSLKRLAESSVKSQGSLARQLEELRSFQTSPEVQQLIQVFESLPQFKKVNEVYDFLGLTQNERHVLKVIDDSMKASKDKFSIYAVSRYASAPKLKKGFKTGREQFAAEYGMTKRELEVAHDLDRFFEETFAASGLEAKRMLGGYWPHLRQWTGQGLVPDDSYLPPEVLDWISLRFRSGELDVYDMNPLGVAFRHARGLLMKQHFDPIMPTVREGLMELRSRDSRLFNIFSEYVDEIIGKPHASFGRAQRAIETSMEVLFGRKPPPDLVRNTISTLTALSAAATIPFRPALIVRNYAESLLKVAPRTGLKYYMKGLQYVTSKSTMGEAFKMAKNAQAITTGPQRLRSFHGVSEAFGPEAGRFNYKLERLVEKGFDWYQSADDWGRAIAFHAQRFRLMDAYDAYRKNQISFDQMLERGKVLMYDPLDIGTAERFLRAGDVQKASDHLGRALSRETMNRYGHGNHPAGWNSIAGRLLGQFGTWPVQYKDYLLQGITRGTIKDRAEFAMIHSAVSGAFIAGGAAAGLNLMSWIGFPSLNYTGGPFAGMAIDLVKSVSGSDLEKSLAHRNLIAQIPIYGWIATGNPRSIFLPGSYLLGDIARAAEFRETHQQLLQASGIRVMKPNEKTGIEMLFDF